MVYQLELKSPINSKDLVEFLEANHNLIIFGDSDAKRPMRELVNKFGVEFENVVSLR
jgi:nickel-dependent lactate racemase